MQDASFCHTWLMMRYLFCYPCHLSKESFLELDPCVQQHENLYLLLHEPWKNFRETHQYLDFDWPKSVDHFLKMFFVRHVILKVNFIYSVEHHNILSGFKLLLFCSCPWKWIFLLFLDFSTRWAGMTAMFAFASVPSVIPQFHINWRTKNCHCQKSLYSGKLSKTNEGLIY